MAGRCAVRRNLRQSRLARRRRADRLERSFDPRIADAPYAALAAADLRAHRYRVRLAAAGAALAGAAASAGSPAAGRLDHRLGRSARSRPRTALGPGAPDDTVGQ